MPQDTHGLGMLVLITNPLLSYYLFLNIRLQHRLHQTRKNLQQNIPSLRKQVMDREDIGDIPTSKEQAGEASRSSAFHSLNI